MPGSINQTALADHLIRVQAAVSPVTVGYAVHTGKMIRRENRFVLYQRPKIRHMGTDVVDDHISHLVS